MKFLRQIGEYLFIVKRDPNQQRSGMMKAMHGMNRISLIMFLVGLIVMLFRFVILPYFK
ncbi:MAG: hypothetical protein NTY43_01205 [Bacteroidetes bacterium]|nr:hypothetical protein [Bacteroidota bacterium]